MGVRIEISGKRIRLTAGRPIRALASYVPGASFSQTGGAHWSLPLSMDTCTLLREHFGEQLEIGANLWEWAKIQRREEQRMEHLRSGAKVAEVAGLSGYPKLWSAVTKTRPYQAMGVRWIADGRNVLIADTVGLGKTPQTIAGVLESQVDGPYLVVCPKTAVEAVWAHELRRWVPEATIVTVPDGRAKREAILDGLVPAALREGGAEGAGALLSNTWVIVHPEMTQTKSWWICRECDSETLMTAKPKELICDHDPKRTTSRHDHKFPALFELPWGAVIADESDKSILRAKGTPTQTRRGMEMLRDAVREDGLRIAQSGTPFRSRPHLLWSTLNWLRPTEFPAFWRWAETYFEMEDGYGGSRIVGKLRADREAMLYRSLNKIMLRRTRAEVLTHLPAKEYVGTELFPGGPKAIWLPMTEKQEKAYRQMQIESVAAIDGGNLNAIGVLAEMTRLKQFANSYGMLDEDGGFHPTVPSNKLDFLVQRLVELGYPDDPECKVVVVSQFTQTLALFKAAIVSEFGAGIAGSITGKVTGDYRRYEIDSFNQPIGQKSEHNPLVLFLNTKAGGSAITLDAADEMIFLDQTWIPDDQEQAEGRIDNRRPEEKIVQRRYLYLGSEDTIDQYIAEVNHERKLAGEKVLDGVGAAAETARRIKDRMDPLTAEYLQARLDPRCFAGPMRRCPDCGVRRNQWHDDSCATQK
jgi:hypothetical protein